ncbi:tricarballylate utilization 4Fe-4S protein TcuB [Pelagibacterium mangrovi]|uniref:tricarballylate utilization 4Fe-4S protein TcuB n=1 Tax=Pelagibacterium mangrovi TaxID=3119828 RepID=UPI002FC7A775
MSIDALATLSNRTAVDFDTGADAAINEARRQLEICNACRYCEGYCSVFPAMTLSRAFSDGEVTQLANLCHNCRGCYYACQYTAPHEFDLNLPRALAEVRVESWERFIWPNGLAKLFQKSGSALVGTLLAAIVVMLTIAYALRPESGEGFYAVISHTVMASLFMTATFLPMIIIIAGVWRYWRAVGGERVTIKHLRSAMVDAGRLKNLSGGAADGCNYEREDRYTMARRWAHQAVMWGFLLCLASTMSGTVLHYVFGLEAPYGPFSIPKLLGVPGGIIMTFGGVALIALKLRAEKSLGAPAVWGGEMAFVVLLTAVAATGLALYAATGTVGVRPLLIGHLGTVLALYLTLPYTKMVHVPFRLAALVRDAQTREQ